MNLSRCVRVPKRTFCTKTKRVPHQFQFGDFMKLIELQDYSKFKAPKLPIGKLD